MTKEAILKLVKRYLENAATCPHCPTCRDAAETMIDLLKEADRKVGG